MTKPEHPTPSSSDAATAPETPTRESPTTDEERIDESVDESFPASDPPAVHVHERK